MRGANAVDIQLFHQFQVFPQLLIGLTPAIAGIRVMMIDSVELYGNISYSLAEIGFLHNICMKSGGEVLTYSVSCEEDFIQGIARFLSHQPEHFDFLTDDLGNNHKIVLDDSLTITVDGKFEYGVARSVISRKN